MCPEHDDPDLANPLEEEELIECPRCGGVQSFEEFLMHRQGLCADCLDKENEYEDRFRKERSWED